MGMSFYFIRHGKTQFNLQHKIQGWCDSPLIEEGVQAARTIGSKLAHVKFVHAYTSDLGRTRQTLAELLDARDAAQRTHATTNNGSAASCLRIASSTKTHPCPSTVGSAYYLDRLNLAFETNETVSANGLPLSCDKRIREWCYGDLEMHDGTLLHQRLTEGFGEELSYAEENIRLPEAADNLARLDTSGRAEHFSAIEARVRSFMEEVGNATLAADGGNVLAITHAFTIRTLMYLYDPARINDPLRILNGSLTRIDYDGTSFTMREIGAMEPQSL